MRLTLVMFGFSMALSGVMKLDWQWVSDMITAFVWGGIIVVVISVFLLGSPG